uniref:Uncharacterized protein MANES_05G041300 n=1 Tax=Rhizophora mucronata TaxID=61149 RepID=A0A2P2K5P3_RHIMU
MDDYGSSSSYLHSNPYPYPYPYHPPPQNHAYPPPNSDPYHPHPYTYPYNTPYGYPPPAYSSLPPASAPSLTHSGALDFHNHHTSPTHSGPLDSPHPNSGNFPYPNPHQAASIPPSPPLPALQHHGSFQYSSPQYHYQLQSGHYASPDISPEVPPRSDSFSSHHKQDSTSNTANSGSSAYPPLDDLLSSMHLNDITPPTAPASQPAPFVLPVPDSPASHQSSSPMSDFCGYPNNSFSSNYEGAILGRMDSSGNYFPSSYAYSSSFNGSEHSQSMQLVPFQSGKGSLKVFLLHGNLDIWVYDARNLPNMDMFHKTVGDILGRLPGNIGPKITSDPYVTISVAGAVVGRTYVLSNDENPSWMQHFYVPVAHYAPEVHFVVKDSDVVGSQLIGVVSIPVEQIYLGGRIEGTYPILNSSGKPCKPGAVLRISIQYIPMKKLSNHQQGVGAGPDYHGVPGTYFPLRKGGTVTLYQDAHVPDGCLPRVKLDYGMSYVHGKCWYDIFDAIRQARRLIYIAGWSVWHQVRLVRDSGNPSDITLGELLRSKSQEGVRVLLLVWDDPTSRNFLGYKTVRILTAVYSCVM